MLVRTILARVLHWRRGVWTESHIAPCRDLHFLKGADRARGFFFAQAVHEVAPGATIAQGKRKGKG